MILAISGSTASSGSFNCLIQVAQAFSLTCPNLQQALCLCWCAQGRVGAVKACFTHSHSTPLIRTVEFVIANLRPRPRVPERLIPNFRVASKVNSVENHVATFGDEVISDGHVTYEYVGTLNGATGWRRKASLA
ncbi:hypothetical protein ACFX16_021865 [Malus domestica]